MKPEQTARIPRLARAALLLLLLVALGLPARAGEDPVKALKSKDVEVRLAAVKRLGEVEGGKTAEKLLIGALSDRDWEVVEHAAAGLGNIGGKKAVPALAKLAITGPVRRVRLAAARSLLALDPAAGASLLMKRVAGDFAAPALEALSVLAPKLDAEVLKEGLARAMGGKDVSPAPAAPLATALRGGDRRIALDRLLSVPEVSVRAATLDAMRLSPDPSDIPRLVEALHLADLPDVLSRRVLAALVASVAAAEPEQRDRMGRRALFGSELSANHFAAARFVRLAGLLAMAPPPPPEDLEDGEDPPAPEPRLVSPKQVEAALTFALAHDAGSVRAAAVHALGRIRTEEGIAKAASLALKDPSARVRRQALLAVVSARGLGDEATRIMVLDRLAKDDDVANREAAATALGVRGLESAVPSLVDALGDDAWEVSVCAAVSLGKTGSEAAVAPLTELASHREWRRRGAAIAGLARVRRKEAVPVLIEALADEEPAIARTAWECLRRAARKDIEPRLKLWREWWSANEKGFEFVDLDKAAREAKKYGYADTYVGVYEDLDVIVLQSRGDNIEQLLDRLSISHRLTRGGQVPSAGVHPYAVFVSNCTGEVVGKDVEALAWFVRVGGYLFCSCWALHHTAELVYPGYVRKYETSGQVLENVIAEQRPTASPYLEGVFEGTTRPIYVLFGAHLIEVLDPESVEVLIDSPDCADRWGDANLACWFRAGHGVILDSANHFDLQGFGKAEGLKGAKDRMAYAMDHMGLGYKELRELDRKKVWASRGKAAAEARDLSAFRFITNFVRQKRRDSR